MGGSRGSVYGGRESGGGVWGTRSPKWGPGAKPLSRDQCPPKADGTVCHLYTHFVMIFELN